MRMPSSSPSVLSSSFAQFTNQSVEFYASVTHPLFLLFISFRSHHYFIQICLDCFYDFSFHAFFKCVCQFFRLCRGRECELYKVTNPGLSSAMFTRETQKQRVLSFWLLGGEGKTGRMQALGHHGQFRGTLPQDKVTENKNLK